MSYLLTSMEEVRKENEKRERILELKEAANRSNRNLRHGGGLQRQYS